MPFDLLHPHLVSMIEKPLDEPVVDIFDIHMHSMSPQAVSGYMQAARAYGVTKACDLTFESNPDVMRSLYGDFFLRCFWPRPDMEAAGAIDWHEFDAQWTDSIDELIASGASFMKLKLAPWPKRPPSVLSDDPALDKLLWACEDHNLPVQIHLAQPDCWWPKVYDEKIAGPKSMYMKSLENVLQKHPNLICISVHLGSSAESPEYIEYMFRKFPNYYVDTSATKWVAREVSKNREKWREIFIRYADRICFGSDLVAREDMDYNYYASRFHVQRLMWETDYAGPSPIMDSDGEKGSGTPVQIHGLNLPADCLKQIYNENARRIMNC